jgi:hypothetical protein
VPPGRVYHERDMRHLWLTLTQAALFREGYDRATRPGAAQPRGATGRSVPFPRVVVGQGEERTRETEPGAIRQGHAFPAEPAVSVSPAAKLGKAECAGWLRAAEPARRRPPRLPTACRLLAVVWVDVTPVWRHLYARVPPVLIDRW